MTAMLWKWELRTTRRGILAVWMWGALISGAASLLVIPGLPVVSQLMTMVALMTAILLPMVVLFLLGWRYYRTMYGGQGYFTHALPVRGRSLYLVKTTYAFLASMVTAVVSLALAALWLVCSTIRTGGTGAAFGGLWDALGSVDPLVVWGGAGLVLLGFAVFTYQVFAGLSLGQGRRLVHLGAGGSLIALVILYLVYEVTNLVAMLVVPMGIYVEGSQAGTFAWQSMLPELVEGFTNAQGGEVPLTFLGVGFVPVMIVVTVVVVWLAVRSIERHTSLR